MGGVSAHDDVKRAGLVGDLALLEVDVKVLGSGGVKAIELIEAITGDPSFEHRAIRTALYGDREGAVVDPMNLAGLRRARTVATALPPRRLPERTPAARRPRRAAPSERATAGDRNADNRPCPSGQ